MAANVLDTIVLFGDSITQGGWQPEGFAQRLAYVYARKLDVINRGLSGYNTEWGLPVFKQIIAKTEQPNVPAIALLTIWFGANDACVPPSRQHVPLSKFSANLSQLVQIIKSPESPHYSPKTRIILFTPPPVNTYQRSADLASRSPPLELDRKFDVTKAYAEAVKEIGTKEGVPVLDTWTALYDAADRQEKQLEKFMDDGLHLNAAGYGVVYDLLIATIEKEFPELQHDKLPMVFKPWAEIDIRNPASSLKANRLQL
ncbi:GDSL Lipase/Acylhydrolase [Hysterangium stoloniferum]|nr:GDSL Lipase/Acylhydrolase [Hysterangium stoloniferum]